MPWHDYQRLYLGLEGLCEPACHLRECNAWKWLEAENSRISIAWTSHLSYMVTSTSKIQQYDTFQSIQWSSPTLTLRQLSKLSRRIGDLAHNSLFLFLR